MFMLTKVILIIHRCVSGVWLGVNPRVGTPKAMWLKEIGLSAPIYVNDCKCNSQHNLGEGGEHMIKIRFNKQI